MSTKPGETPSRLKALRPLRMSLDETVSKAITPEEAMRRGYESSSAVMSTRLWDNIILARDACKHPSNILVRISENRIQVWTKTAK